MFDLSEAEAKAKVVQCMHGKAMFRQQSDMCLQWGGFSAFTIAHRLSCREEGASLGRAREVCGAKLVLR